MTSDLQISGFSGSQLHIQDISLKKKSCTINFLILEASNVMVGNYFRSVK